MKLTPNMLLKVNEYSFTIIHTLTPFVKYQYALDIAPLEDFLGDNQTSVPHG
jgi:hypothetical protein